MLPVLMECLNGRFHASVVGWPTLRAEGATKQEALVLLRVELNVLIARGDLVWLDVSTTEKAEPQGLLALAGKYRDDPSLDEIVRDAYRYRAEEKEREFPE